MKIREKLILANIIPPGRKIFTTICLAEITVPDLQPSINTGNHLVGRFHLAHHQLCILLADAFFFQKTDKSFVELWFDRDESESAAQSVIHDGERAVGGVHAAYQINILGHKETFIIFVL